MKFIHFPLLGMLMLLVCACGNQGKDLGRLNQSKDSMIIIAVNTPNGVGYFVDSEGKILFKKQFEEVDKFSEGLAPVKQNGKWGFINTKGEVVVPFIYDKFGLLFSEGLARVKQNGKWGFINTKGEMVTRCIYDDAAWEFTEGLARVKQNGKWGFINTKGEVIAPCIYNDAWDFSEGLTLVKQNGKWSIINKNGKVIVADCRRFDTRWSKVEME